VSDASIRLAKPKRSRRIFTWRSSPKIASKSKLSIARLWRRVAKTMVRLVCARSITRTTMQLSSLVRTGTTSKWFATNPRPNPSIEGGGITKRPLVANRRRFVTSGGNRPAAVICDWPLSGRSVGSPLCKHPETPPYSTALEIRFSEWSALRRESVLAPILRQMPMLHRLLPALGFSKEQVQERNV
jgi:hypothetical protein